MALGGKKWGQAGYRARPDIHPLISPSVPCTVSTSRSAHLNLEIIAEAQRRETKGEREDGRGRVVCPWQDLACESAEGGKDMHIRGKSSQSRWEWVDSD